MRVSSSFLMNKKTVAVRLFSLILPAVVLVMMLSQTAMAKNTYVIKDGSRVVIHTTNATDPARVLNEAGLSLNKDDTFVTQDSQGVSEIMVRRVHTVTVNNCGQISEVVSNNETVEEILSRLHVETTGDVSVSADLSDVTTDGMVITVTRNIEVEEAFTDWLPYATSYVEDDTIPMGVEVVVQEGVSGEKRTVCNVRYTNGLETSRTVISEEVVREPVECIIAVGTAVTDQMQAAESGIPVVSWSSDSTGQIALPSGEVLTFNNYLDVLATAYTCEGWSSPGITATGTIARVGEIAVDPDIIPLGSRLFIRSADGEYIYGVATAEDTGGLINGYRIDLYFDTEDECWTFGARMCEVYFLS